MRRSNAPTLQDIADAAGVSVMMASVVLNGAQSSTRVSQITRERILEIASKMRYRRNAVAHGLSRQRMNTIGVTATIDGGELNLYFLEVLNGILEGAAERRQNTTIFSITDWRTEGQKVPEFCDGRVDGMILIAPDLTAPELHCHHTPCVTIHGNEENPNTVNIDVDNETGAYRITRLLLEQGHRNIVHLPGNCETLGVRRRIAGFERALEEFGIHDARSRIIEGAFSVHSGRVRMSQMLDTVPPERLPDALFCGSDAIAYGCMEILNARSIRVPADISVAGFDDTLMARLTSPALTTVSQPFRSMGRCAVESLLSLIDGWREPIDSPAEATQTGKPDSPVRLFPAELVIRDSVGPAASRRPLGAARP